MMAPSPGRSRAAALRRHARLRALPLLLCVAVAACAAPHAIRRSADAATAVTPSAVTPRVAVPGAKLVIGQSDSGLPRSGQWRNSFDVADMNEDGRPDLVFTCPRKAPGPPVIFLNAGGGQWERWREARFPPLPYDYGAVAVADFNRDGHADLAIASHYTGVTALTGDGRGAFTPFDQGLVFRRAGAREAIPAFSSRAVVILDWNQDGRPDLAALSDGPRPGPDRVVTGLTVYESSAEGWRTVRSSSADPIFGDALAAGDFDGDDRPDLVTAAHSIGERNILRRGLDATLVASPLELLAPRSVVRAVALNDFDADGRDEIVVGSSVPDDDGWSVAIDLVSIGPSGTVAQRVWVEHGEASIQAVATGDLDTDGVLDLAAITNDGRILTFRGNGRGALRADAQVEIPDWRRGCSGYGLRIADTDGDGPPELIASFADERALTEGTVRCPSGGGIEVWHVRGR
jgi:hypothetical protein